MELKFQALARRASETAFLLHGRVWSAWRAKTHLPESDLVPGLFDSLGCRSSVGHTTRCREVALREVSENSGGASTHLPKAGCCRRSPCQYAHGEGELRIPPNLTKTAMCKSMMKHGSCRHSEQCRFAHDLAELRATEAFFKITMCRFHAVGKRWVRLGVGGSAEARIVSPGGGTAGGGGRG